ncbi:MAG: S41 family peptidase, partial [Lentimicrobium sp.]|uniref:S41 family peptidase n=1 Tax=Lentimicrobium sp. TaxID=2034841 RepID=UPI0025F53AE8
MSKITTFVFCVIISLLLSAIRLTFGQVWPITNEKHGSKILYKPNSFIGTEKNTDGLFISGAKGAFVVSPFKGVVLYSLYTYQFSLIHSQSMSELIANEIKSGKRSASSGELQDLSMDTKYISLSVAIKTDANEVFHFTGLSKFKELKTGMKISIGDTIGLLSYCYKQINLPCLMITRSLDGVVADPMTPLGLKSTFVDRANFDPKKEISIENLKTDFKIFKQSLEEGHPGLYDYISKQSLDSLFNVGYQSINKSKNSFKFEKILNMITSNIRDKHIQVLSDFTSHQKQSDSDTLINLPINFGWVNDDLIITRTTPEFHMHLGMKIKRINGIEALVLKEKIIQKYRFEEGFVKSYYDFKLLTTATIFALQDIIAIPKSLVYSIELIDGEILNIKAEIQLSKQNKKEQKYCKPMLPQWSGFLRLWGRETMYYMLNDSTGYLDLSTFDIPEIKLDSIALFVQRLCSGSVPNLIIDVRFNDGGSIETLNKIFSMIASEPFRLTEMQVVNSNSTYPFFKYTSNYVGVNDLFNNYIKFKSGNQYYLPSDSLPYNDIDKKINYKGNVYVLANEHSFSAASVFAALVYKYRRGIIIGRETGNPYHQLFGEKFAHVVLPNSQLVVRIPLVKCVFDSGNDMTIPFGRCVLPDYEVPLSREELEFENDLFVKKALDLISMGITYKKKDSNIQNSSQNSSIIDLIILIFTIVFVALGIIVFFHKK